MIRVTIDCWECHNPLKLTSDDCTLRVANKPTGRNLNRLSYPCAFCKRTITQPVDQHIIVQLSSVGTVVKAIDIPMEVLEPYPAGPAISYNDILAFHEELRWTT